VSDPFVASATVRLKPGREASLGRRHPWLYRGALAGTVPAGPAPILVTDADGRRLGTALPGSSGGSLALRMVAWGEERWDAALLRARLERAVELRRLLAIDSDAVRLVHAEGDGLPGLVVDRYADVAVVETFEAAWQPLLGEVSAFLLGPCGCAVVLERAGAGREPARVLSGAAPAGPVIIREGRLAFPVDVIGGQKTGFFLDQRDNRRRVGELAAGRAVLNLFSYSGGFAVAALAGGARRAVNVDASRPALELARAAYRLNGLAVDEGDFVRGDAFVVARELAGAGARFDLVVVDPPAFVRRKGERRRGLDGYRDINLQALRLLSAGGLLLTCSCSALVDEEGLRGALLAAALDAGRELQLLEWRGAAADHPVALACPEPRHLKALLCRVP
jgi:23S rRNA (cytosine1962-C5)-methyltransferase